MSTAAQTQANRQNATHSSGPTSPEGKATTSQNHRSHGLTGGFQLLDGEDADEFCALHQSLLDEHQPQSPTEQRIVKSIAEHYWLMQRAISLQTAALKIGEPQPLSLVLRYQTTHERAYYRAMKELRTIRKEASQQQIGFESQKRQQEMHDAKIRLTNAKAEQTELETEVRTVMEVPLPGHIKVPFSDLASAFRVTLQNLNQELDSELARRAPPDSRLGSVFSIA